MEAIVERIVEKCIQSELIEESQCDWMAYSLQRKFMNFGGFFILVCFGILVAPLPQVILLNFGLAFLREKTNGLHKVAEKLFDQKLYCAVCGTLFARKTRTSGAVVWGCRKHLNKSGLCSVKSVYETELCRAFLCMHNKLLINQEKIFEPLLNSLSHLKSYQEKLDTMRMGIQVEIQRLAKQKHNLERIYAQGLIEDSQYLERKALIEQQLFEKKEFLTRKPLAGNIDRLLKNTRLIKRLFGTCQPLMYFDKQVFTSLVSKVTISDTSFEFELINGMRVSERRTSK